MKTGLFEEDDRETRLSSRAFAATHDETRGRLASALRFARALLSAALLSSTFAPTLRAQQTPAAPTAPESSAPPKRPRAAAPRPTNAPPQTTPAARPAPADATPSAPAPARAPQRRDAASPPRAPVAPREVITVVHRLSGWKLLSMLAATRSPRFVTVDELPFDADAHTSIVAGYVSEDGRTVVARLPQAGAEAEAKNFPAPFFQEAAGGLAGDSELSVVRGDGTTFNAKFIGLDASTGLSFLEVEEPLVPPAPAPDAPLPPLFEGQRVHLFAPEPMNVTTPPTPPTPAADAATVGDTGVVYSMMGAVEAQLVEVRHAPTGPPIGATVRTSLLRPEWAGAIALDDSGALVGIMTQAGEDGAARLVPAESVRVARRRVLSRRASVPRPWLGARGNALSPAQLDNLLARGWTRERALELLDKRLGVLLTAVAPGTPAARAGLRPGDVVARVSERDVKGLEEFSFFLNEAGVGSTLDFTVLRAGQPDPLRMAVRLSGARNPATATREAESRDAETLARVAEAEARSGLEDARAAETQARNALTRARAEEGSARTRRDEALLARAQQRVAEASAAYNAARALVESANRRLSEARSLLARTQSRKSAPQATPTAGAPAPLVEGLETIGISPKLGSRLRAGGGLLVINVQPESPAESAGLRVGDLIETVNHRPALDPRPSPDPEPAHTLGLVRNGQKLSITVGSRR